MPEDDRLPLGNQPDPAPRANPGPSDSDEDELEDEDEADDEGADADDDGDPADLLGDADDDDADDDDADDDDADDDDADDDDADDDARGGGNRFGTGSYDLPIDAPFPDRYEDEWGLDHAAAVAAMTERLRIDPEDAGSLTERGRRWVNLGQYDRALADFAEALRLDDEDTDGLWGQAMIWACCPDAKYRNGEAALQSAEVADSLGGTTLMMLGGGIGFATDYKEAIAAAHAEMGDFDAALRAIDLAESFGDNSLSGPGIPRRLEALRRLYESRTPYRWHAVPPDLLAAGARLAKEMGDLAGPHDPAAHRADGPSGMEPQLSAAQMSPEARAQLEAEFPISDGSLTVKNLRPLKIQRLLALPGLAELRTLALDGDLDGEAARALAAAAASLPITSLQVGYGKLGDAGAAALAGGDWSRLTSLRITSNDIEDDGAAALGGARLGSLESLDLSGNHIGDAGGAALLSNAQWPRLAKLNLSSNRLNRASLQALAGNGSLSGLVEIDLDDNRIDAKGAAALAGAGFARLESLSLCRNHLRDAGAAELWRAGFLQTVKRIELHGNHIGSAGVKALAACRAPELEELDLSGNLIGDDGAAALAGSPLRPGKLRLYNNRLGPAGVAALAASPICARLTELALCGYSPEDERNIVGAAGARALAESPHLAGLTQLSLKREGLDESDIARLDERFGEALEWK